MILGDALMYEVVYADGLATGAVRFDKADTVSRCRDHVLGLLDEAENIEAFFDREVRSLPAPRT
jgi:hypothetical protein